jgi:hypothetical protein
MGDNPQREQAQQENLEKGDRFEAPDGSTITNNPAQDKNYPEGSEYIARTSGEGEKDPTMIVGPEGDILNEAPDASDDDD